WADDRRPKEGEVERKAMIDKRMVADLIRAGHRLPESDDLMPGIEARIGRLVRLLVHMQVLEDRYAAEKSKHDQNDTKGLHGDIRALAWVPRVLTHPKTQSMNSEQMFEFDKKAMIV